MLSKFLTYVREKTRGVENSGEGKTYHKTPSPKTVLDPPPPMIRFPLPPSFVHALSFSLEGTGTDQTNPIFWALQNWFWRARSIVRFPPPKFRQEKRAQILTFWVRDRLVGWGSSTRRGGGRKVRALPREFVFLGFRREESGISREFGRDVPDPCRCSKSLC